MLLNDTLSSGPYFAVGETKAQTVVVRADRFEDGDNQLRDGKDGVEGNGALHN